MKDPRESTQPTLRPVRHNPHPDAPPRFLFWLAVGLFAIAVIAVLAAFLIYSSEGRLVALVPIALLAMGGIALYSIILAVVLRSSLPRLFALWVALFFVVVGVIGALVGVSYYRDSLPPRYQTELLTPLPFLRAFLPPTPAGGVLPTAVVPTGGPSAADLLLMGVGSPTPSVTVQPPTQTLQPSATPTATLIQPTITSEPEPTAAALVPSPLPPTPTPANAAEPVFNYPSTHYNGGFTYVRQTWNNCGPANVTMALSFFGWDGSQEVAASFLKPDREDKNVSPGELVRFVNEQTFVRAITRIGGSMSLIKSLVSAGFPVIVEVGGTLYEGDSWVGHYRTIVGYDDVQGVFLVYDSWLGTGDDGSGVSVPYAEFDDTWEPFNRVFIVVYEPAREGEVISRLGEWVDVQRANEIALETADQTIRENPQDYFAYFNRGSALTRMGRYSEAALAFDQARNVGGGLLPFRMLWYQFYPFEAYFNEGRYADVLALVNSNLTSGGEYVEETHYWRGRVLANQGDVAGARSALQRALLHNPRYTEAQEALATLPNS